MFLRAMRPSATLIAAGGVGMVQRGATVAFEGIEARAVDVQVQVAPGLPAFNVVGLPDKAVSEARERGRAALGAPGLALPARAPAGEGGGGGAGGGARGAGRLGPRAAGAADPRQSRARRPAEGRQP